MNFHITPVNHRPKFNYINTIPKKFHDKAFVPAAKIKNPWIRNVVALPMSVIDIAIETATLPITMFLHLISATESIARLALNTTGAIFQSLDKDAKSPKQNFKAEIYNGILNTSSYALGLLFGPPLVPLGVAIGTIPKAILGEEKINDIISKISTWFAKKNAEAKRKRETAQA